jgi:hypothetical protein
MEISKDILNSVLENGEYEAIIEKNLHSGPHYSMVFEMDDKLYKAYYIEGSHGPRWLSPKPSSETAECTEVVRKEETRIVIGYVDVHEEPSTTPMSLDYYL